MSVQESSFALRALYGDLLRQVAGAPMAGTPYSRSRDGISYLYAKLPAGRVRVDRFLGRAGDPAAQAEAAELRRGAALARERRRTVAALRAAGLAGPGRAVGATLEGLAFAGLFEGGAVLVGDIAYLVGAAMLGRRLSGSRADPGALDIALNAPAFDPVPVETILRRVAPDFAAVLRAEPGGDAPLLSPEGYRVDGAIRPRGVVADPAPARPTEPEADSAPMEQLGWLIERPVRAVALWGAGVPVAIPDPARLAVHSLIVAGRRSEAEPDERAAALLAALREEDSEALEAALSDARSRGWAP